MKINCADIVVRALERAGVRHTFGIPGTHNIELYDALDRSASIEPVLVTDEQSASFMADAVSRTSGELGVVNVVPGAGVTHALSGIAEAYMDNVPLLVLTCGIRTDTGMSYQLHDVDQLAILAPVTKGCFRPETPSDIDRVLHEATELARSGAPGPVAVEIPANFYFLSQDLESSFVPPRPAPPPGPSEDQLDRAARMIQQARTPILYLGLGARNGAADLLEIARRLSLPAATTIQGKGVFPEDHPLWLWCGLGESAPFFVSRLLRDCDCLLAIGCRFGEVATGSYGFTPTRRIIHVDIEASVLGRNFPAELQVHSDSGLFARGLLERIEAAPVRGELISSIEAGHASVSTDQSLPPVAGKVSPAALFSNLQRLAGQDSIFTTDSGNGTFLAMEHLRLQRPGCFIGPVDYSCMGYSVPAAIGAAFACPGRDAIAIAGDGALLMTGLELITAARYGAAPLVCVLRDGELGQIAQFQRTSLDRDTCSVLSPYSLEGLARTTGCLYLGVSSDEDLEAVIASGLESTRAGSPVLIEVTIDYSRKTYFTRGVVTTNFWRLPWSDRVRMLGRAVSRRLGG